MISVGMPQEEEAAASAKLSTRVTEMERELSTARRVSKQAETERKVHALH